MAASNPCVVLKEVSVREDVYMTSDCVGGAVWFKIHLREEENYSDWFIKMDETLWDSLLDLGDSIRAEMDRALPGEDAVEVPWLGEDDLILKVECHFVPVLSMTDPWDDITIYFTKKEYDRFLSAMAILKDAAPLLVRAWHQAQNLS